MAKQQQQQSENKNCNFGELPRDNQSNLCLGLIVFSEL